MMPLNAKPNCTDPVWLPFIDAAFAKPGSAKGKVFARECCPGCPVFGECHVEAVAGPERGPWAGSSSNQRTRRGALSPHGHSNISDRHPGVQHGKVKP
jgi:hypothetical protein